MSLDCEVVLTHSGAPAMLDRITGEVMHPVVGPLAEAERLYVEPSRLEARLRALDPEPLVLLDVGLGAGSNAAAAWRLSESLVGAARRLRIVSFDRSLAALELALAAEHAAAFGLAGQAGVAARALCAQGRHDSVRSEWQLRQGELSSTLALERPASADVVFWDPFSPLANPELWTASAFSALFRVCRAGATVHTYSGATRVRSALLLAGFAVGTGEKVGEGKYATIAALGADALARPLDQRWLSRLGRSSAPFPPDAPADAFTRIAALPQFEHGSERRGA
jgi:queuine tRNA-ribosyltransferase